MDWTGGDGARWVVDSVYGVLNAETEHVRFAARSSWGNSFQRSVALEQILVVPQTVRVSLGSTCGAQLDLELALYSKNFALSSASLEHHRVEPS